MPSLGAIASSCSLLNVKRIGVVVPTLFTRPDYLEKCLESILAAGDAHVLLMGPNVKKNAEPYKRFINQTIEEPIGGNLSAKISLALRSFPKEIELVTWIGDDDLLQRDSLKILQREFERDDSRVLAFGSCDYIDSFGSRIGTNRSSPWSLALARVGPFLAPQPGSLFLRKAFEEIDGLDEDLRLAFDFDLFLSLAKQGRVKHFDRSLASFRWHEDSLSVGLRKLSVKEASIVRNKHASSKLKVLLWLTNPFVELATYIAGSIVNQMLRNRLRNKLRKEEETT